MGETGPKRLVTYELERSGVDGCCWEGRGVPEQRGLVLCAAALGDLFPAIRSAKKIRLIAWSEPVVHSKTIRLRSCGSTIHWTSSTRGTVEGDLFTIASRAAKKYARWGGDFGMLWLTATVLIEDENYVPPEVKPTFFQAVCEALYIPQIADWLERKFGGNPDEKDGEG